MRECLTADEQCSSLRGEPSFPSQKKPRRVRARRREKNSIRFLPGRVPGKKHFSARKRANRPLRRPICALQRAASSFLQRPLAFVRKNSPGCPGETPRMPCRLNSNLHIRAGGSPKFCFAASNFRPWAGRPAIRRLNSASLIRDVGFMSRKSEWTHTHTAERFVCSVFSLCAAAPDQNRAEGLTDPVPLPRRRRGWS